jgi:transcription elongation factor Elf1
MQIKIECHHCHKLANPVIRIHKDRLTVSCQHCGAYYETNAEYVRLNDVIDYFEHFVESGSTTIVGGTV